MRAFGKLYNCRGKKERKTKSVGKMFILPLLLVLPIPVVSIKIPAVSIS